MKAARQQPAQHQWLSLLVLRCLPVLRGQRRTLLRLRLPQYSLTRRQAQVGQKLLLKGVPALRSQVDMPPAQPLLLLLHLLLPQLVQHQLQALPRLLAQHHQLAWQLMPSLLRPPALI